MKKDFLTFVIGVLIGAIIATGVFIALELSDNSSDSQETSMQTPSGDMGDFDPNSVGGERPDDMGDAISNNSSDSTNEDE